MSPQFSKVGFHDSDLAPYLSPPCTQPRSCFNCHVSNSAIYYRDQLCDFTRLLSVSIPKPCLMLRLSRLAPKRLASRLQKQMHQAKKPPVGSTFKSCLSRRTWHTDRECRLSSLGCIKGTGLPFMVATIHFIYHTCMKHGGLT